MMRVIRADGAPSIRRDMISGDRRSSFVVAPDARGSGRTVGVGTHIHEGDRLGASLDQAGVPERSTEAIVDRSCSSRGARRQLRVRIGDRAFYDMFAVSRERAQSIRCAASETRSGEYPDCGRL